MKHLTTFIAAAALLAACSVNDDNVNVNNYTPKVNIKIHAGIPQTRTSFGDKNDQTNSYPVFWDEGDSFAIVEHIGGVESQVVTAQAENISADRKNAEIFAELAMKRGDSFDYYAYSPCEAYSDGAMIIPAAQTPDATSVDPSALLLCASKEGLTAQTPELELTFGHIAAYARMTVYGLSGEADDIVSVTFTTEQDLAGAVDVASGELTDSSKSLTIDVSSLGYTTADKFDVWFTAAPQEEIAEFTVGIATKKAEYSKDFVISGGKLLAFRKGVVSNFTVNMSDAESNNGFIYVEKKGTLEDIVKEKGIDTSTLDELRIAGHLNIFDYEYIKTIKNLNLLDLTEIEDDEMPTGCLEASKISTVLLPKALKKINDRAFYGAALTAVTIPETVEYIGDYAFYQCKQIKGDLVIPDATTYIGDYCFYQTTFDGTLTIGSSVATIGQYAFSECSNFIGDLVIPDSVTTLGTYAFAKSGFTGNITIGNSITAIPDYCFYECSNLTGQPTLGESITKIGNSAFYMCSSLSGNLIIPDSVQTIAQYAFLGCTGFTGYLSLGSSMKSIGTGAFVYLTDYKNLQYSGYFHPLFSRVYSKATTAPNCRTGLGTQYNNNTLKYAYPDYVFVPTGCRSEYTGSFGDDWYYITNTLEVDFD